MNIIGLPKNYKNIFIKSTKSVTIILDTNVPIKHLPKNKLIYIQAEPEAIHPSEKYMELLG